MSRYRGKLSQYGLLLSTQGFVADLVSALETFDAQATVLPNLLPLAVTVLLFSLINLNAEQ